MQELFSYLWEETVKDVIQIIWDSRPLNDVIKFLILLIAKEIWE